MRVTKAEKERLKALAKAERYWRKRRYGRKTRDKAGRREHV